MEFTTIKTLGLEAATELGRRGIGAADSMNVSGVLVVYSRTGMLEFYQARGDGAAPRHVEIAMAKAKTALNMRRSTREQAKRMKDEGWTRDDFANLVLTTIPGGLALFADRECTEFVGAMAFSGGKPTEDEAICAIALRNCGLWTDLQAPEDSVAS